MRDVLTKLESLHQQKEISLLELEFAWFLHSMDSLAEETVILTGAACVHFQQKGHICTSLNDILEHNIYGSLVLGLDAEQFSDVLSKSGLIGNGETLTPMVMENELVYLHKFWKYEKELADWMLVKAKKTHSPSVQSLQKLEEVFPEGTDAELNWQKVAAQIALLKDLVIISGGPGTGKTFTVQKIIQVLEASGIDAREIALAAPTGKAAQRLNDALGIEDDPSALRKAQTVHKLLGAAGTTGEFRYNEKNKLRKKVVIVDEASMLDLSLWVKLIRAIPENAKLIVLGDKNQLASVEAGSILGDLCWESSNTFSEGITRVINSPELKEDTQPLINDCVVMLTKSYRFGEESGIKRLSDAIKDGDSEEVLNILSDDSYPEVTKHSSTNEQLSKLINDFVVAPYQQLKESAFSPESFNRFRILCALRRGPFGVESINELAERTLKREMGISMNKEWFEGRPVLITKNNSSLKLRNGETGIYSQGTLTFEGNDAQITPSRLPDFELSYANTVHKSQGSEYENVAILLSNTDNKVLTKELFYTAVTRARQSLLVIGNDEIITSTIRKVISRKSGLRNKIWK